MTRLIGLWGYAGSGKDEAARALVEDGWRRDAFADRLRAMLLALDPIVFPYEVPGTGALATARLSEVVEYLGSYEDVKRTYPEVRALLQRMGTEAGRHVLGEDIWADALMRDWYATGCPLTVVTDMRFPNELAAIRGAGGLAVAILRPDCGPINGHASETALADWPFDFVVNNDRDIEHLHEVIRAIASAAVNPRAARNVEPVRNS